MPERRAISQLIWGLLLTAAGIGVFYRIPQVMPQIRQIGRFSGEIPFIKFCFYLIGVLLIGGGLSKIVTHYRLLTASQKKQV